MLLKRYAKSRANCFPFLVARIIEHLLSRAYISRVTKPLDSRRSITRVTLPLSLPTIAASFPGVILCISTHRTSRVASCTVRPYLKKQRSNDVCSLMHVWKSQDTRRSLLHSCAVSASNGRAPSLGIGAFTGFRHPLFGFGRPISLVLFVSVPPTRWGGSSAS